MKTKEKSEYDIQAEKFLENHPEIKIKCEYVGHRPHFTDETAQRAVFCVTLERENKNFSFFFGDSFNNSYFYFEERRHHKIKGIPMSVNCSNPHNKTLANGGGICGPYTIHKTHKKPSDYDILACLSSESYDPETFEDFCSNFGYDTDSEKSEKTYFAVQKQYKLITRFFTAEELEELREIQ